MLLDFGWSELMLIGIIALIVIGPKDLPKALRVAGFWVRKARTLSREFQSSVEQMVREAELDEMRQELKKATEIDLEKEFRQAVDPTGSLAESLKPPELPNFAEHAAPAADSGTRTATGAAEIGTTDPVAPTIAPPKQVALAVDSGAQTATGAAEIGTTDPVAPAIAPPDTVGHDIVPPKP
jgi:sec-independent protein translocase protein TatB